MVKLLGISGSLRAASYNTGLLRATEGFASEALTIDAATLHGIPLYDGDVEARDGIPAAVETLKAQILASDGLLLFTPEYNNGIPGVFKNAIDWLSRPGSGIAALFGNRPVAVAGASPGGFGTLLAQTAWLPVLRMLGCRHWSGGRLLVSRAGQAFADDGTLEDEKVREQLGAFVQGFAAHIRETR